MDKFKLIGQTLISVSLMSISVSIVYFTYQLGQINDQLPQVLVQLVKTVDKLSPTIEQLDQLQQFVYNKTKVEGKRSISMTKLGNKTVLRLVIINELITSVDVMETIEYIRSLAKQFPATE